MVSASVLFVPLGIARWPFLVVALAAGGLFLAYGLKGIFGNTDERWARNEFFISLTYLTVLLVALLLDHPHALTAH